MTPIIFTNYIDEGNFWFNLVSGGFVGIIFINPQGQFLCHKETDKLRFRFPGGGIDLEDGSLIGVQSKEAFLEITKKTAVREAKEEIGQDINSSRLKLIGFSEGKNDKDEKGGQVHIRVFFFYHFFPGEKVPNESREILEDSRIIKYEYRWVSIKNGRADLEEAQVRLSDLHFAALVRYLRASH
jgi:8-oxo-dGTP pyrophosphatase MutT (NUDIX family)